MADTFVADTFVLITCQLFGCFLLYGAYYLFLKPTPSPENDLQPRMYSTWDLEERWPLGRPLLEESDSDYEESDSDGAESGSDSGSDGEESDSDSEESGSDSDSDGEESDSDSEEEEGRPRPPKRGPVLLTDARIFDLDSYELEDLLWGVSEASDSDYEEEERIPAPPPPPTRKEIRVATLAGARLEGTLEAHSDVQRDLRRRIDERFYAMAALTGRNGGK